jgi:hypothetical protein
MPELTGPGHLSLREFAREVTRRADNGPGFRRQPDTLDFAVKLILRSPRLLQSRALARLVVALCDGEGLFRGAELYALDASHTSLAADLVEARRIDAFPDEQWKTARFRLSMALAPDAKFWD